MGSTQPTGEKRSIDAHLELGLKDKLKTVSEAEMLALLAQHGKLIKRPVISDGERVTGGFDEATFERVWRAYDRG
ncbi:MAG: hypothetical protein IMW86_01635 [Hydrogenibacillus sp.]|nr:hypothetical protein [Hydrogenibacillus sp.]